MDFQQSFRIDKVKETKTGRIHVDLTIRANNTVMPERMDALVKEFEIQIELLLNEKK